jgi:hypothetical protein
LKHWRTNHPDKVKAQRQRARARNLERLRELTRLRVARWRTKQLAALEAKRRKKKTGRERK